MRYRSNAISNHSLIPDISVAPLHYYSEALPTTALILCRSLHAEALQATASEGQGHYTGWLEWDSNLQPFRQKAPNPTTEPPRPTTIILNDVLKHKIQQ